MKTRFKLKEKITVAGNEIDAIELREITTRDVREIGLPYSIALIGTIEINTRMLGKYIVRLSNLTELDVDKMPPQTFQEISMEIFSFFGEQMGNTQASASVS